MRTSPFFPRRLDPVLNRGERHKDPMISPEVPAGRPIGQAILDHQTHRPLLNAMGVMTIGQSQIVCLRGEAPLARSAPVLGVCQVNVQRPLAAGVAQIV